MDPDNNEVIIILSSYYLLKKVFYKYLDQLTSANLLKCNLNFLKSCKSDKIIPISLLPNNLKKHQSEPFPLLYEHILDYYMDLVKKDINKSFLITKVKFRQFQEEYYNTLNDHSKFTKLIDYAHYKMKRRCSQRKLSHIEKSNNLFKSSPWF